MAEEGKKEMGNPEKGISRRDFLKGAAGATAALGLAAITGCVPKDLITPTPETPTPTPQPTEVPTPTQEIRPTPTIAPIEITPREIGGVTGEEMAVEYNGESQKLFKYTLSNGETFFLLGYYPKLPGISERTDLGNEVVYYDGQPFVFLTAMASLEGDHEALPFYDRNVPKVGILRWIENGEGVSQQAAFEQLQEGEASVQFPGNGNYEFLDKEGKILRTKEIFKPVEVAPVIEGLVFNPQDGKYYVEAGNPYGLEVGVYAGEKIVYNQGEETGLVLAPEVVKVLMKGLNTPEQIAEEEWVIPFPLDPRGEGVENLKIQELKGKYYYFMLDNLPNEATFISSLPECRAYFYHPDIVDLLFPPEFDILGKEFGLAFFFKTAELAIPSDGQEVEVSFGQRLFGGVSGRMHDAHSNYAQVGIFAGAETSDGANFGLRNILKLGDFPVFLVDKNK